LLIEKGRSGNEIRIRTGSGIKHLRLIKRNGSEFLFEMNMGTPRVIALKESLQLRSGLREATLLDVGNPQCAYLVDDFNFDWRGLGAETERHPRFLNRTNVSFVKPLGNNAIDVRFFERGAGETMSSGTGSTGAAAAAIVRGLAASPVTVITPAGELMLTWSGADAPAFLTGPAQIVAEGHYRHEIIP
jgi:diaminopimelate epimerase